MSWAMSTPPFRWVLFLGDSTQRELTSAFILLLAERFQMLPRCLQMPPTTAHEDWNLEMTRLGVPGDTEFPATVYVSFRYIRGNDEDKLRKIFLSGARAAEAQQAARFRSLFSYIDGKSPALAGGPWRCRCTERAVDVRQTEVAGLSVLEAPDVVVANLGAWMLPHVATSARHYARPWDSPDRAASHYSRSLPAIFDAIRTDPALANSRVFWRETYCVPATHRNAPVQGKLGPSVESTCLAYNALLSSLVQRSHAAAAPRGALDVARSGRGALLRTQQTLHQHDYAMRDAPKGHVHETRLLLLLTLALTLPL